eukprot:4016316-Prymnesium_polylepis.1
MVVDGRHCGARCTGGAVLGATERGATEPGHTACWTWTQERSRQLEEGGARGRVVHCPRILHKEL